MGYNLAVSGWTGSESDVTTAKPLVVDIVASTLNISNECISDVTTDTVSSRRLSFGERRLSGSMNFLGQLFLPASVTSASLATELNSDLVKMRVRDQLAGVNGATSSDITAGPTTVEQLTTTTTTTTTFASTFTTTYTTDGGGAPWWVWVLLVLVICLLLGLMAFGLWYVFHGRPGTTVAKAPRDYQEREQLVGPEHSAQHHQVVGQPPMMRPMYQTSTGPYSGQPVMANQPMMTPQPYAPYGIPTHGVPTSSSASFARRQY